MARDRRRSRAGAISPPRAHKPWTALFYLCGDHPSLTKAVAENLQQLGRRAPGEHLHIAIQHDHRSATDRYVLGDAAGLPQPERTRPSVNTGDPRALLDFLAWGLRTCPSDRVALVVSGMGFFHPDSTADTTPGTRARLFSFCDDYGAAGALDIRDFHEALQQAVTRLRGGRRFDLLAFDICEMQFLEVAYQLEHVVDVLVAPQTDVPACGWAYDALVHAWSAALATEHGYSAPARLAEVAVANAAESYAGDPDEDLAVSAVNLRLLDEVTRAFDSFTEGMTQVLGEDLVWQARERILTSRLDARILAPQRRSSDVVYDLGTLMETVGICMRDAERHPTLFWLDRKRRQARQQGVTSALERVRGGLGEEVAGADDADVRRALLDAFADGLPEPPLLERLDGLSAEQRRHAEAMAARAVALTLAPTHRLESGLLAAQQAQVAQLARLTDGVRAVLEPATAANPSRFVIALHAGPKGRSGTSIYRPGRLDALTDLNYVELEFHRRVHWAVYLTACNLIEAHPRALWRIVSSLLSSASPTARANVLRHVVGEDSVVSGLRLQMRALSPPAVYTLSLEPVGEPDGAGRLRRYYRLRLASDTSGATLAEQMSRIDDLGVQAILDRLEAILAARRSGRTALSEIASLGHALGEDVLQGLAAVLMTQPAEAGTPVHLALQLPVSLMRFPWELMHHGTKWIGDRFALGRQLIVDARTTRWPAARRPGPLRALVVAAPRLPFTGLELPGAVEEGRRVAALLTDLAGRLGGMLEFDPERDAMIDEVVLGTCLRDRLRYDAYDIVHFAGHAYFDPEDPERSAWLLSDGPLWAVSLRNTLGSAEGRPWLVFANACQAGGDGRGPLPRYQQDVFGLASAFINQGVAAYIAPQWPIADGVAVALAERFYRALLFDRATLGEALCRAKRGVRELVSDGAGAGATVLVPDAGMGWASVVLYGDPAASLPNVVPAHRLPAPAPVAPAASKASPPKLVTVSGPRPAA